MWDVLIAGLRPIWSQRLAAGVHHDQSLASHYPEIIADSEFLGIGKREHERERSVILFWNGPNSCSIY